MTRGLLAAALGLACLLALAPGCGDEDAAADGDGAVGCDPGHEAWVRRAYLALLGKRPTGIREVRVLADLAAAAGRDAVVQAIMDDAGFVEHWSDWLIDELLVDRTYQRHAGCFEPRARGDDDGGLARAVRDGDPLDPVPGGPWTMADLTRSALRLDDLSVVWRANIFPMITQPSHFCPATPRDEMDIVRRREFGQRFTRAYTHRGLTCLGCHSTRFSVTDAADPAADRHWPIGPDADVEALIYGAASADRDLAVYSAFRYDGVIGHETYQVEIEQERIPADHVAPVRPWGAAAECGTFYPPGEVREDVAGLDGFLVEPLGAAASIWDVEALFTRAMDAARALPRPVDTGELITGADTAFAFLLASRIAERAWLAAMGHSLTMGHFFPRNQAQRDKLAQLTGLVLDSGWSLRAVLSAIAHDPVFALPQTTADCESSGYGLPAILDPTSVDSLAPEERGNSVGDAAFAIGRRAMIRALTAALGWGEPARFQGGGTTSTGQDLSDSIVLSGPSPGGDVESGFLLEWRAAMSACADVPNDAEGGQPTIADARADWITALVRAAEAEAGAGRPVTVGDVAGALFDRLLNEPDIDPEVAPALASLFGVSGLDAPFSAVADGEMQLRRLCGVLASSPGFVLSGTPMPRQVTTPGLVVDGETAKRACERWLPAVRAHAGEAFAASCGDGGVEGR